ncbi:MAG: heavy metal sensor histidine kinase [Burkholderiales bacterium]|nr:heavy metal sensor histidine kinase [Burkholderiales bacterium]
MNMLKPRRAYSLGMRLSWLFAALTILGLGVISLCIFVVMYVDLEQKADTELRQKTQLVKHLVSEAARTGDMALMRHKLDEYFASHEDMAITLLDRNGTPSYAKLPRSGAFTDARDATIELSQLDKLPSVGSARIALDRSADSKLLRELVIALGVATALGALVISMGGFWIVRRSMAPLVSLARQTSALRVDQLGQRLALTPPVEELQPWIDQFNGLLGRLEQAYVQLEGFNADVAHELRTPLATLIGQSEVELARVRSADELRETLGSNLEELHRLGAIVNDMLFLSRADRGARAAPSPQASLRDEVLEVAEFYEAMLADKRLTCKVDGDARTSFERGLVRRAVSNLLSNAIRYAEPDSAIQVDIARAGATSTILVQNDGAPLSQLELPRLFDRFYRIQASREGGSENHGLGLAIVAAIARMHDGDTIAQCAGGRTSIGFTIGSRL